MDGYLLALCDSDGMAALSLAARKGSKMPCSEVTGIRCKLKTFPRDTSTTPLHQAVLKKSKDIVALLLDNGADINAMDSQKNPALSHAIESKDVKLILLLLERKVNVCRSDPRGPNATA
jgi:ankyrin repeat protein